MSEYRHNINYFCEFLKHCRTPRRGLDISNTVRISYDVMKNLSIKLESKGLITITTKNEYNTDHGFNRKDRPVKRFTTTEKGIAAIPILEKAIEVLC